jgi:hypothetical protein
MSPEDFPADEQIENSQSKDSSSHSSRSEGTSIATAPAVAAVYDSALSQLNRLDDPDGAQPHPTGSACESTASPDPNDDRDPAAESSTVEESISALDELNGLCRIDDEGGHTCDSALFPPTKGAEGARGDQDPRGNGANQEGTDRDTLAAATDAALIQLSGPPSFDRVIWHDGSATAASKARLASSNEASGASTVGATPADYQQALLQIIEEASNDPSQLRNVVFELARTNLRREIELNRSRITPEDIGSLETAIARIEIDASRWERASDGVGSPNDDQPRRQLPRFLLRLAVGESTANIGEESMHIGAKSADIWPALRRPRSEGGGVAWPATQDQRGSLEIVYPERSQAVRVRRRVWLWFIVWPFIQLAGPAIFCLFLYFILAGRLDVQESQARRGADVQPVAEAPRSFGLPLPSAYGIFAVSGGSLYELQPLPIRAPDPRIQLSAEITKPSTTTVPDGRLAFVLFERDLVNTAPQKLTVRVVARVMNDLKFSSGKAATAKPDASWHIRGGNPYTFQVSPLNENREMVAARPEDPELVLPSGRYVLVLGGIAYDFTVDGPITDIAQCLESFQVVGGAVFNECRPQ